MTYIHPDWHPQLIKARDVEYTGYHPQFDLYLYDLLPSPIRRYVSFMEQGSMLIFFIRHLPLHLSVALVENLLAQNCRLTPGAPDKKDFASVIVGAKNNP